MDGYLGIPKKWSSQFKRPSQEICLAALIHETHGWVIQVLGQSDSFANPEYFQGEFLSSLSCQDEAQNPWRI